MGKPNSKAASLRPPAPPVAPPAGAQALTPTFPPLQGNGQERSTASLMPEGQLESLAEPEVRDLFAYLMGSVQAPLPVESQPQP